MPARAARATRASGVRASEMKIEQDVCLLSRQQPLEAGRQTCSTGERTAASSASGAMEIAAGARRRLDVGQGGMTEGETFFVLYIIAIAFILAMLAGLMQLAHKRMVPKWRRRKHDEFRARNGHSWDYVLVFKVFDADDNLTSFQKKFSVRKVVERITQAGLETKMFFSLQRDEVFVKIRCPLERLKKHADDMDYKLLLDPVKLRIHANKGKRDAKGNWVWLPIDIEDSQNQSPYDPYDMIYGKYDSHEDLDDLYKRYGGKNKIFRGVDRLRLIRSILENKEAQGGAGLKIRTMVMNKAILAAYPLHDYDDLLALQAEWLRWKAMPDGQPFLEIRDYFGEKVALYFMWLGCYTKWLMYATLAGFIAWIQISSERDDYSVELVPVFATFLAVWSTLFLEHWKRCQVRKAMEWGMTGFEEQEEERPEFTFDRDVITISSPVNGQPYSYFPLWRQQELRAQAQVVIQFLTICVIAAVFGIFVLKFALISVYGSYGSSLASVLNAGLIAVMNAIYSYVSRVLNDREKYRTDTQYEDALIAKTFVFQVINSYSSLIYLAFVNPFVVGTEIGKDGCNNSCMPDLNEALGTIFLMRLLGDNIKEVGVPVWKAYRKRKAESSDKDPHDGLQLSAELMSAVEEQYCPESYDILMGPFGDYLEMAIQFGYAILFAAAFPLAPMLALANNFVEIRVDAWKVSQQSRRVEPKCAEDIGTWQSILEAMAFLAVLSNCMLIAFTSFVFKVRIRIAAVSPSLFASNNPRLHRRTSLCFTDSARSSPSSIACSR